MTEQPPKEPGKEGEVIYVGRERIDSENFSPEIEDVLKRYRSARARTDIDSGKITLELVPIVIPKLKDGQMKFPELEKILSNILRDYQREKVWKAIIKHLLPDETDSTKDRVAKIINFDERKKS